MADRAPNCKFCRGMEDPGIVEGLVDAFYENSDYNEIAIPDTNECYAYYYAYKFDYEDLSFANDLRQMEDLRAKIVVVLNRYTKESIRSEIRDNFLKITQLPLEKSCGLCERAFYTKLLKLFYTNLNCGPRLKFRIQLMVDMVIYAVWKLNRNNGLENQNTQEAFIHFLVVFLNLDYDRVQDDMVAIEGPCWTKQLTAKIMVELCLYNVDLTKKEISRTAWYKLIDLMEVRHVAVDNDNDLVIYQVLLPIFMNKFSFPDKNSNEQLLFNLTNAVFKIVGKVNINELENLQYNKMKLLLQSYFKIITRLGTSGMEDFLKQVDKDPEVKHKRIQNFLNFLVMLKIFTIKVVDYAVAGYNECHIKELFAKMLFTFTKMFKKRVLQHVLDVKLPIKRESRKIFRKFSDNLAYICINLIKMTKTTSMSISLSTEAIECLSILKQFIQDRDSEFQAHHRKNKSDVHEYIISLVDEIAITEDYEAGMDLTYNLSNGSLFQPAVASTSGASSSK